MLYFQYRQASQQLENMNEHSMITENYIITFFHSYKLKLKFINVIHTTVYMRTHTYIHTL